jgi:hypothetical protein
VNERIDRFIAHFALYYSFAMVLFLCALPFIAIWHWLSK